LDGAVFSLMMSPFFSMFRL
jgi:hypothetical protein